MYLFLVTNTYEYLFKLENIQFDIESRKMIFILILFAVTTKIGSKKKELGTVKRKAIRTVLEVRKSRSIAKEAWQYGVNPSPRIIRKLGIRRMDKNTRDLAFRALRATKDHLQVHLLPKMFELKRLQGKLEREINNPTIEMKDLSATDIRFALSKHKFYLKDLVLYSSIEGQSLKSILRHFRELESNGKEGVDKLLKAKEIDISLLKGQNQHVKTFYASDLVTKDMLNAIDAIYTQMGPNFTPKAGVTPFNIAWKEFNRHVGHTVNWKDFPSKYFEFWAKFERERQSMNE